MDEKPLGYLEQLANELGTRGLIAHVVRGRTGPAICRVVNPAASSMSEQVTCAQVPNGSDVPGWYYWWSWGERMHQADDPGGAATKVAHVLLAECAGQAI